MAIQKNTLQILPQRVMSSTGLRFAPQQGQKNIALSLTYDGKAFQGYQSQPHARSVQDILNQAWQTLTGEKVTLYGCSRLDSGVHAQHFVLNLFTASPRAANLSLLVQSLNGILHSGLCEPISIYDAWQESDTFNARFDAIGKHYRYLIWYGRGTHAQLTPRTWHIRSRAEPQNLAQIMSDFKGEHDFNAFRASDCNAKTTIRTVSQIKIWNHPRYKEMTIVDIWGEGFLKNMIRNMVGSSVDIATQKSPISAIKNAFKHKDRTQVGQCAPALGLSLMQVYYNKSEYDCDCNSSFLNAPY